MHGAAVKTTREEADAQLAALYHSDGSLGIRDIFTAVRADENERIAEALEGRHTKDLAMGSAAFVRGLVK